MKTKYVLMENDRGRYWACRHESGDVEPLPIGYDLVFRTDPDENAKKAEALPFPVGTMVTLEVPKT